MIRSLKVSQKYIKKAKQALINKNLTHKQLAIALDCTRTPISNFFNSKPISRDIFIRLCQKLSLDWREITGLSQDSESDVDTLNQIQKEDEEDIDSLLQTVRQQVRNDIQERCG